MVTPRTSFVIGQEWTHKRTGVTIVIVNIYRKDRVVMAREVNSDTKQRLPFGVLRLEYTPKTMYV